METNELPTLLTPDQAAQFLQVNKSWIYQRTRGDIIPVTRIGGLVRIPRDKFLRWIAKEGIAA